MLGKLIWLLTGVTLSISSFAGTEFDAKAVAAAFANRGMSCGAYSPDRTLVCKGALDPKIYPLPIAILIPPHFDPSGTPEIILHLHGFTGDDVDLEGTLSDYKLAELLPQTGRNSILVVPASVGQCNTFKTWLAPRKTFNAFLLTLKRLLHKTGLSAESDFRSLVLSGHSGSYSTIEAIVRRHPRQVQEVYLFDALYNDGADFLDFIESPGKKFYSVFIPLKNDTGTWKWTAKGNFEFWQLLNPYSENEEFLSSTLPGGASWTKIQSELATTGLVLMRSNVDHGETVIKYFPKALRVK